MLSVIVETAEAGDRLPALLASLTSAAVEGLVREVLIAGGGPPELLAVLREETGAELAPRPEGGHRARRGPSACWCCRRRSGCGPTGWSDARRRICARAAATRSSRARAAFSARGPFGVLVGRAPAAGLAHPDLNRLRRQLGRGAVRLV